MSDDTQDTAAGTWQGILSSLVFAAAIAAVLLAIFAWATGKYRDFYYAKHYQQRLAYTAEGARYRTLVPVSVPRYIHKTCIIFHTYNMLMRKLCKLMMFGFAVIPWCPAKYSGMRSQRLAVTD
jgi:hypothetical protein